MSPPGTEARMVVFFDIDGTLVDQQRAEATAAREFLAANGDRLPRAYTHDEFCRRWRALHAQHLPAYLSGEFSYAEYHRRRMRDLFECNGELSAREIDARFAAFYEPYRDAWALFDDVQPALAALAGATLGVISNGHGPQQRLKLARTGIAACFDVVVVADEVGAAKPDAALFQAACARVNRAPHECVHVGDELAADAEAATAAGLRGLWLARAAPSAAGVPALGSLRDLPHFLALPRHVARDGPPAHHRAPG